MDDAIVRAGTGWRHFCEKLQFHDGIGLRDRIVAFAVPFMDGVRATMPAFKDAPDALLMLIVAKGVERSGTHSRTEIEEALGILIPE